MKLYDGGTAPNPRRVEIFIQEKGIELDRIAVSIHKLENREEAYSKINPMKKLPALQLDDGEVITETVAICRYLERVYPKPALMGETALEEARIEMWQRRCELDFFIPVAQSFRHLHPAGALLEGEQVTRWGEINQGRATSFMELLDGVLSKNEFIAGEKFTIADITAITATQFLKPARISLPSELTNFKRWFDEVSARPSCVLKL